MRVSYVYDLAVAVYPDVRGCGQVSSINGGTGRRGPTRTAYADKQIVLSASGSTILAAGPTRLEMWRSDLVRMLSYGEIDARVKPVNQGVGTGCTLMSAAASDEAVGVLEACRDQKDLRLTLLKPAKEEDEPDTKNILLPGWPPIRRPVCSPSRKPPRRCTCPHPNPRSPSTTTPAPRCPRL